MRLFNKVVIIGVGLIGGSIGLALKKKRLARHIIGISRSKKTVRLAISRGAIDSGFQDLSEVSEADLVILATPVNSIIRIGIQISALIRPDALVCDTGSTKKLVVNKLEGVLPNFVGTHPLSGSERQGVENARDDLFRGSLCVVTPTAKTPKSALSKAKRLWVELGSRVVYLSPARHDKLISYVSHLPHILAFSLIRSVPNGSLFLASSGLRDSTRIASSPEEIWKDIFLTNSENVLGALERFAGSLFYMKSAVRRKDARALKRILRQSRLKRQTLNALEERAVTGRKKA